jgi:hypothetical protein
MSHPLIFLSPLTRRRLLLALLACTLLLAVVMNGAGGPLTTPQAPNGIVSFEIAGDLKTAQDILDSWDTPAKTHAGFVQGLDFLFLLVYSTTLGLACLAAGGALRRSNWPLAGISPALAWGMWLAALFDFIENVVLVLLLFGQLHTTWPPVAAICAYAKFALLFIGLVYVFYAGAVQLAQRFLPRPA